jgi:hypothetical protein
MKTAEAITKPERQKRHPLRTLSDLSFGFDSSFVIRITPFIPALLLVTLRESPAADRKTKAAL